MGSRTTRRACGSLRGHWGQIRGDLGTPTTGESLRPPGICRAWVTSKKTGYSNCFMMPKRDVDDQIVVAELEAALHRESGEALPASSHLRGYDASPAAPEKRGGLLDIDHCLGLGPSGHNQISLPRQERAGN